MQAALLVVESWVEQLNLSVSVPKTNYMLLKGASSLNYILNVYLKYKGCVKPSPTLYVSLHSA